MRAAVRTVLVVALVAVLHLSSSGHATAAAGTSFSFGAAGDFGANDNVTATLTAMANSNLNFAMGLGDLSYNQITPESAWCQYVHQNIGSLPFELVSGNHEDGGDLQQGLIGNFTSCMPNQMTGMAGTYGEQYFFDYPAANPLARFIMISPGLKFSDGDTYDYSKGGKDYNWVSNEIDAARAQGIQWIIVGMHKVCLSTGASSCDIGTDILNLLISKHVDLILDGHDHSYQRTKQVAVNASSCPAVSPAVYNAACVSNPGATGAFTEGNGPIMVTAGTGGVDDEYGAIYANPDSSYFASVSGNNLNPQKGFVKYTVSSSGISAVFVPSTNTSSFTDSFSITPTGQPISTTPAAATIMSTNFDGYPAGPVPTGGVGQLTGVNGAGNVSVVSSVADSATNSMRVGLTPSGGNDAYEQYSGSGYSDHSLSFGVQLGADFALPPSDYMVLAQTQALGATGGAGKVNVILGGNGNLELDYTNSLGAQNYVYSHAALTPGSWHTIDLQEAVGVGTGYLALYFDGKPVATASAIDLGAQPVGYFAVGEEYAPNDAAIAGSMYIDDLSALSVLGFPPATGGSSGPPTGGSGPSSIESINFDNQSPGPLVTGMGTTQFGGAANSASLTVENTLANSQPNALQIAVSGAAGAYAYQQYALPGYYTHTLQFSLELGLDFALPAADYMTIAQTLPENAGGADTGKVSLIMTGGGNNVHLDYVDSSGAQHYLWTGVSISPGTWHTVAVQETVGNGTGALVLTVDGQQAAAATNITPAACRLVTLPPVFQVSQADTSHRGPHVSRRCQRHDGWNTPCRRRLRSRRLQPRSHRRRLRLLPLQPRSRQLRPQRRRVSLDCLRSHSMGLPQGRCQLERPKTHLRLSTTLSTCLCNPESPTAPPTRLLSRWGQTATWSKHMPPQSCLKRRALNLELGTGLRVDSHGYLVLAETKTASNGGDGTRRGRHDGQWHALSGLCLSWLTATHRAHKLHTADWVVACDLALGDSLRDKWRGQPCRGWSLNRIANVGRYGLLANHRIRAR